MDTTMDPQLYHQMNQSAVKKVDPSMVSILDSAKHVALYSFNNKDSRWEKTSIEGALFIYSRSTVPQHAFIVMNRLSTNNLVETVNEDLDFQIKEPFLLYKTRQSLIYGIWFYDQKECYRIAGILQKLVKGLQGKENQKEQRKDGVGGVDIFSMLSRAQEDFNTRNKPDKVEGNKNTNVVAPKPTMGAAQALPIPIPQASNDPQDATRTPQSVMDFFAKASNTQFPTQEPDVHNVMKPPPSVLPAFFQQPPAQPMLPVVAIPPMPGLPSPPSAQRPEENMKPILMRIMSNPVHSVEHIEKQQRSNTPDSKTADFQQNQQAHGMIENGIKFLRMSPLAPTVFFGTPPSSSVIIPGSDRPLSAPLGSDRPLQQPALIPPGMFSTPSRAELDSGDQSAGWILGMSPPAPLPMCAAVPIQQTKVEPLGAELVPLTRNQLLQAISYLIKNDSDFVNKLHEAYVKSFNELIS